MTSPEGHTYVYSVKNPSYDGIGTYSVRITILETLGLLLVQDMNQTTISDLYDECVEHMGMAHRIDQKIGNSLSSFECGRDEMIFERPDFAKACDTLRAFLSIPYTKARVIRPLDSRGTFLYLGNDARREDFAALIAVCVCHGTSHNSSDCKDLNTADCEKWTWKGVFE